MQVRIFQRPKTAMQSGRAHTERWVLEFEPDSARQIDPLMGWTSSADTKTQLDLTFDSRADAEAYARKKGYMYTVEEPRTRTVRPRAYADNFKYDRRLRWTH